MSRPVRRPGGLRPTEMRVHVRPLARFAEVLPSDGWERTREALAAAADLMRGRVVWHVNSTGRGGGVAEMLNPLVGYARDAGVDARWAVIEGTPAFFAITKRLHNHLHADPGDGGALGDEERRVYEAVLRDNAVELAAVVRAGDVVVLHDPQTAGLAPVMRRIGARVAWRCHIGHEDLDDPRVELGWAFLERYLRDADVSVFSRAAYVPRCLAGARVEVVAPTIDPFAVKNQELADGVVHAILSQAGIVDGPRPPDPPSFTREDGAPGRVDRGADIVRLGRLPQHARPLVVQISRWDRLKDHLGVMRGFALLHAEGGTDAGLVLAGPSVHGVADDPEGPAVLDGLIRAWRALPHQTRRRIQLVSLPTVDSDENAAMVNALQRHATVVVQKSLQEGFGLTVAEAMWKSRPVLASAVGGIVEQIHDGRDGVLLQDPSDPREFATALAGLLDDPERAADMGVAAKERVRGGLLTVHQLADEARIARTLLG